MYVRRRRRRMAFVGPGCAVLGALVALGALVSLAACSSGGDTTDSALDWSECGRVECATLGVPLDHDDPQGAMIDLALARRPADGRRIGSLLMNPGGPGSPGLFLVDEAELIFPESVLDAFDIVSWDPRGTGESTAVDCLDDLDEFWAADRTPDDRQEQAALVQAAQTLVAGCVERSNPLLAHLSSLDTVADMDAIRAALGDESLTYVGYSYGTLLGALYADRYPDRVRALVLDGAIDPSLTYEEVAIDQGTGFDVALDSFLAWCADRRCELGATGDPAADYDALMASLESSPLAVDGRELGPGEAELGVVAALYGGEDGYPTLARALEGLREGDGSLLLDLSDVYSGRREDGSYTNENEAFFATGCIDGEGPTSVEAVAALADEVAVVAPRLGPSGVWIGLPCVFWPVEPELVAAPISASGAPPILVLGTTGDPATPPQWAESLASQLDSGVLVTLDATGHVASGRGFECVDQIVADYLVDLVVPESGTRCEA